MPSSRQNRALRRGIVNHGEFQAEILTKKLDEPERLAIGLNIIRPGKQTSYNMPKQVKTEERHWYAIHTYSGYEDNVARNLKQRVESLGFENKIFNVLVPKEKKIRIRGGKRETIEEKLYAGYVLVEMIVDDASWYVVRNTPNVTGFIGAGTIPTPLAAAEMDILMKRMGVQEPKYKIDVAVDDRVKITDGPFKDFDGKISEVDPEKGRVKVLVTIFGRETPVELDFLQIKKL